MAKVKLSFTGEERTFEPIPPGKYPAYVHTIVEKDGQSSKIWNVRLTIAEGQFEKRSLFTNCPLSKDGKWKLQNLVMAAGMHPEGTAGDPDVDSNDLQGKKVGVIVVEGSYNNEPRPEVKNFYKLGGSPAPSSAPAPSGPAPAATAPAGSAPPPPAASGARRL